MVKHSLLETYNGKILCAGGVFIKIVNNQPQILMVIKNDGQLVFPKGHVEGAESLEKAALREVHEETGLKDLSIQEKMGVVVRDSIENTGEKVTKTIHLFKMMSSTFEHEVAEEHYGWFTLKDAIRKMKFVEERDFLKKLSTGYSDL